MIYFLVSLFIATNGFASSGVSSVDIGEDCSVQESTAVVSDEGKEYLVVPRILASTSIQDGMNTQTKTCVVKYNISLDSSYRIAGVNCSYPVMASLSGTGKARATSSTYIGDTLVTQGTISIAENSTFEIQSVDLNTRELGIEKISSDYLVCGAKIPVRSLITIQAYQSKRESERDSFIFINRSNPISYCRLELLRCDQ